MDDLGKARQRPHHTHLMSPWGKRITEFMISVEHGNIWEPSSKQRNLSLKRRIQVPTKRCPIGDLKVGEAGGGAPGLRWD